jgi:hypothetical protein
MRIDVSVATQLFALAFYIAGKKSAHLGENLAHFGKQPARLGEKPAHFGK